MSITHLPVIILADAIQCFGYETGYAINLARDFGPRLMAYTLGYGTEVWSAGGYYFWIPMVAPFCGCLFGGFLYDVFIYTGPDSPINSPYMGLPHLFQPRKALRGRWAERKGSQDGRASDTTTVDVERAVNGQAKVRA